ncbi:MAG: hypothetical protein JZU65_22635 [Chlorobium sp.]|nr:hypothetical protein [Chlorobium sp.]
MKVSTSQTFATDHVNCFILVNGEEVGRPKVCSVGVTWDEAVEFMEDALLREAV